MVRDLHAVKELTIVACGKTKASEPLRNLRQRRALLHRYSQTDRRLCLGCLARFPMVIVPGRWIEGSVGIGRI